MNKQSIQHHGVRKGFSLIELVIVVVIIGIISAIAIPRLSRGAEGADEAKLKQDLAVLNKALELYAAEHGGEYPSEVTGPAQLTQYTDATGNVSSSKTGDFIYGPYLRDAPPATGGARPGAKGMGTADAPGIGWLYSKNHGRIHLNRGFAPDFTKDDEALGE
jgi:general secretion pathway protein G